MQTVPQSQTINLDLVTKNSSGSPINPTSILVTITRPDDSTALEDALPIFLTTGLHRYSYDVGDAMTGIWTVTWSVLIAGDTYVIDELFEVAPSSAPFVTETSFVQTVNRGDRVPIDGIFRVGGERTDAEDVTLTLADPDGGSVSLDGSVIELSTGAYRRWWNVSYAAIPGVHVATLTGTIDDTTASIQIPIIVSADPIADTEFSSGINRVAVGDLTQVDAVFRTGDGQLWDPDTINCRITDPTGNIVIDQAPNRLDAGVYREQLALGIEGYWLFQWSASEGSNSASVVQFVEVVANGPGSPDIDGDHSFGASIRGVRSFLPGLSIDNETRPSINDVSAFIDNIATEVSLRIGPYTTAITDSALINRVTQNAKYVVELGAAATTQDAAFQAKARPNDSEYGGTLWERYREALEALILVVNNATPGDDPGAGTGTSGGLAVSAPPPMFTTYMEV